MASAPTSFAALPIGAKLGLLALILGLISSVYYFVFHMPLTDEIEQVVNARAGLQQQLADARERQQEFLRISQELASREALDRANKRVLPENAEIPAFLQDLNRLAELSGLSMNLVEPRPEEQAEMFIKIPVTLRLNGRFHQISKFFYNVSRLERAISMEDVRLTQPRIVGEEVVLNIDVRATTFRRPVEGEGQ